MAPHAEHHEFVYCSSDKIPIYFVCEVHRNMDTTNSMNASLAAPSTTTSFDMPATDSGILSRTGTSESMLDGSGEASFLRSPIFIGVTLIITLAIIGFNVFSYLGDGTEIVAKNTMPVMEYITGSFSWFVNKLMDNTSTGTKGAVDVASSTVKAGAAVPHQVVSGTKNTGQKGAVVSQQNKKKIDATSAASAGSAAPQHTQQENSMQTALDSATPQSNSNQNPEPSSSDMKLSGPGYCYIGEDQGHRSCISVSDSTKCMSGDVYPNLDACQRRP